MCATVETGTTPWSPWKRSCDRLPQPKRTENVREPLKDGQEKEKSRERTPPQETLKIFLLIMVVRFQPRYATREVTGLKPPHMGILTRFPGFLLTARCAPFSEPEGAILAFTTIMAEELVSGPGVLTLWAASFGVGACFGLVVP